MGPYLQVFTNRSPVLDIASSANANAVIDCLGGWTVVGECTADSSFTGKIQAQFVDSGDWADIPYLQMDGGVLYRRVAGTNSTWTDGDVFFASCPGATSMRILRAAGSSSWRLTAAIVDISAMLDIAGMSSGAESNAPLKYAIIDNATSGDNTLVAAVTGKKIRVISGVLVSSGTVNVRFESGAGGTALSGVINLVANTGFIIPYNPDGNFETAASTLLNLELSGAVSVDGWITYKEI